MEVKNNIIKHYLKNVYFITGTAYAGKSTMCKLLAERYGMIHCEENYNSEVIFKVIEEDNQPNLSYFNTKKDWQEFVNRSPKEYDQWIVGNAYELSGFEVAELIRLSSDKKVIVDTNIPIDILCEIADYNQIAIMVSNESISSEYFFKREDPEKLFIKEQILSGPTPEKTMKNFKACLAEANGQHHIDAFHASGCLVIQREDVKSDDREMLFKQLSEHFGL